MVRPRRPRGAGPPISGTTEGRGTIGPSWSWEGEVGEGGREGRREVEEPLALERDGAPLDHRGLGRGRWVKQVERGGGRWVKEAERGGGSG